MPSPPRIVGAATALPPHYADQASLLAAFRSIWGGKHFNLTRLEQLFSSVRVGGRHLALPIADYPGLTRFSQKNDAWIRVSCELGERAARDALARAGLEPRQVDHIYFVSVTGIATPSIDARLVPRLGLRPDVKRTPIFGLGCLAGAAGITRAADAVRAYPGQIALLVAVELCSLTLQQEDFSIANLISSGLFGDGAAALVLAGGERPPAQGEAGGTPAPRVVATRSVLYPGTERVMGWDVVDTGFRVVLSADVAKVVETHLRRDVDAFLAEQGLSLRDLRHVISHPGGPKVLSAIESALELPADALRRSWDSLRDVGNLSSASVLFVLDGLLRSGEPRAGDLGLLLAMGPGFCSELVLLRW